MLTIFDEVEITNNVLVCHLCRHEMNRMLDVQVQDAKKRGTAISVGKWFTSY